MTPKSRKCEISEQHRRQGLFSVHVYGWEDIVDRLSDFSDLYRAYLRELRLDDLKIGGQRLPRTTGHLYGREAELQSLTEAWQSDGHNVLSIVAWGGVGKTALVKHWMGQMAVEKFRGAERIFTWSFYSQGAKDQAASADQFIDQALRFFEDPDPTQGGPYERGERLASVVSRFKTLLVLDGLEPLQYPSGTLEGQLKDPALQMLLDRLSLANPGLCLMTTREKMALPQASPLPPAPPAPAVRAPSRRPGRPGRPSAAARIPVRAAPEAPPGRLPRRPPQALPTPQGVRQGIPRHAGGDDAPLPSRGPRLPCRVAPGNCGGDLLGKNSKTN